MGNSLPNIIKHIEKEWAKISEGDESIVGLVQGSSFHLQ